MGNTSTETIIKAQLTKSAAEELVKTLVQKKETVAGLADPVSVKHTAFLTEVIGDIQAGLDAAAKAASPEAQAALGEAKTAFKDAVTTTEAPKYG